MTDPATILLSASSAARAVPLKVVQASAWPETEKALPPREREWLRAMKFKGEPGQQVAAATDDGNVSRVFFGWGDGADRFALGRLARTLPQDTYRIEDGLPDPRL